MTANRLTALLLAVLGAMLGIGLYFYFKPSPAPVGVHIEAKPAPEVAKIERVPVAIAKPVQVYRPAAKQKLKLPESVQRDEAAHVVASTKTAPDERQHTVTTLIDADTGETTTFDRVDPLPWIAPNTKTDIGAFLGYKGREPAIRLEARQELLQIKAVHLGATASADLTPGEVDTFVGVGLWARW